MFYGTPWQSSHESLSLVEWRVTTDWFYMKCGVTVELSCNGTPSEIVQMRILLLLTCRGG